MKEVTDKLFIECLNRVANSTDGKIVLSYLKDFLHWDDVYMASDNKDITQYHAIRRGVYAGLRKNIDATALKDIEFNYKRKAVSNERSGRNK